ncbi:(4Fe-4S)-binding protein [Oceanobacillus sp. CAU 1775]
MNEKELLENGYRKYTGEKIDVFFNKTTCVHSGNCVNGNPDVFDTKRRPWILADGAEAGEVARVIDTCPSGALKYIFSGQTQAMPQKDLMEKEGHA